MASRRCTRVVGRPATPPIADRPAHPRRRAGPRGAGTRPGRRRCGRGPRSGRGSSPGGRPRRPHGVRRSAHCSCLRAETVRGSQHTEVCVRSAVRTRCDAVFCKRAECLLPGQLLRGFAGHVAVARVDRVRAGFAACSQHRQLPLRLGRRQRACRTRGGCLLALQLRDGLVSAAQLPYEPLADAAQALQARHFFGHVFESRSPGSGSTAATAGERYAMPSSATPAVSLAFPIGVLASQNALRPGPSAGRPRVPGSDRQRP